MYDKTTKMIHNTYKSAENKDALTPPIFQTSTFVFPDAQTGMNRFSGEEAGYIYSRLGNPTTDILGQQIADLEGAEAGLCFGSGMAAISAVLTYLVKSGDHILCTDGLYGCTFGFFSMMKEKFNVDFSLVDMSLPDWQSKIQSNTKVIYVETPINPTLKLVDLEMVSHAAKDKNITTVIDNTFMSPYLQNPIELGCDVVIHSATKFIGGHGDVIAGIAVGPKTMMDEIAFSTLKDIGGVLGPFDAWLLLRGVKTLAVRMEQHCNNAEKVAAFLQDHPKVKALYYPGSENFPQKDIVNKQMKRAGSNMTFELHGGIEMAMQFLNDLHLIKRAVSLGDIATLIQHPASMTHSPIPLEERLAMGITDEMIRLSVGLEFADDIIADLAQALDKLPSVAIQEPVQLTK